METDLCIQSNVLPNRFSYVYPTYVLYALYSCGDSGLRVQHSQIHMANSYLFNCILVRLVREYAVHEDKVDTSRGANTSTMAMAMLLMMMAMMRRKRNRNGKQPSNERYVRTLYALLRISIYERDCNCDGLQIIMSNLFIDFILRLSLTFYLLRTQII